MKILITGGSGFIGSYLCDLLFRKEHDVVIIDNLQEQIHGEDKYNSFLFRSIAGKARFYEEDILNSPSLGELIEETDIIVHLAAETGVGQSMYNVFNYVRTNSLGTANILEQLVKKNNNLKKFILASSRAVYGEGRYKCPEHGIVYPDDRDIKDLHKGEFECKCSECGKSLEPISTDEGSKISPKSVYGISKYNQEELVRSICGNINIPYTIFRFQNVYGMGQPYGNPYTGIISIFSKLSCEKKKINVFEDGLQSRDFIHASDVSEAIYLDILSKENNQIYNVGTGIKSSLIDIIKIIGELNSRTPEYEISGSFRVGDIRHSFADISKISNLLGFKPKVSLRDGMHEVMKWVDNLKVRSVVKPYESSINELKKYNLYYKK